MAFGISEILANRTTCIGRPILHRRGITRGGGDNNRVIHRPVFLEGLYHLSYRRSLLPDGHIHADDVLTFLIDDRIDREGGLTRLPVTDDQLALAAADWDHGVDWLQSRLQRFFHRLAVNNTRGNALNSRSFLCDDWSFAVDRLGQSIHYPADKSVTNRNFHDATGAANLIPFSNLGVVAKQHDTHLAFFEIQRQTHNTMGKYKYL